jgi:hypothetical protein
VGLGPEPDDINTMIIYGGPGPVGLPCYLYQLLGALKQVAEVVGLSPEPDDVNTIIVYGGPGSAWPALLLISALGGAKTGGRGRGP